VGGSSQVPKVRELVTEFFGGKTLHITTDPDEAIA
jgi:molecular chaperone DnaK (HSP70)